MRASEVAGRIETRKYRLLDVRPKAKYDAGRIPGAARVESEAWSQAFAEKPDKEAWTKCLGALGLHADDHVVVYGDDVREVARVWWVLRY